jgi:uncharacterized protein (TIGR03067 family)
LVLAATVVVFGGAALGLWYAFLRGPTADLDRLQGEWRVVVPGRDEEAGPPVLIRVAGDRWTYVAGGREQRTYRVGLNPAASPKEIDLVQLGPDGEPATYTHGPGRGSVVKLHGVYSVNKDEARVVLRPGVEPRPTSLDDPGDAQTLTLKRTAK